VPTLGVVALALAADALGGVLATGVNVAVMEIGAVTLALSVGSKYPGFIIAALVKVPPPPDTVHATLAALPSVAVTTGDVVDITITGPAPPPMVASPVVPFFVTVNDTEMPTCPDAALCTSVPANVPFVGVTSKYR